MKKILFCWNIVFMLCCIANMLCISDATARDQLKNVFDLSPMYAAVIVEQARFLDEPDLKIGRELSPKPRFRQALPVYGKTRDGKFFQIKIMNVTKGPSGNVLEEENYGWVPAEDLLTSPICMQAKDPANPAYVKAATKNNWRIKDEPRQIEAVPVHSGPGKDFAEIGKITIFNIRYAYLIRQGHDRNGNPEVDENGVPVYYVFLGDLYRWDPDRPEQTLTGWVRKDYAILWNSRVAAYYNEDNRGSRANALIFKEQKPLLDYLKSGQISPSNPPIAEELPNAGPIKFTTTRFPILETDERDGYQTIKVAFVGSARHNIEGRTITNEEISSYKNELYSITSGLMHQDILFLFDATKSMKQYLDVSRDAVKEFLEGLSKQDKQRIQAAVAVYTDYSQGSKVFQPICPLTTPDQAALQIKGSLARDINDPDFPEAVFNGVIEGINQTNWRKIRVNINQQEREIGFFRAVVLIGDHGNHEIDQAGHTAQGVANKLRQNRISFYSINVRKVTTLEDFNKLFRRQANEILSLNKGQGMNLVVEAKAGEDVEETKLNIINALQDILVHSNSSYSAFHEMLDGKSLGDIDTKYGTRITNYIRDVIKDAGLGEEDINLTQWSQMCMEGWLSRKTREGEAQVRPWVFMTRKETDELVGFLAGLLRVFDSQLTRAKQTIEYAVARTSGDKIRQDENLGNYLQRIYSIPYHEVSDVLKYTPAKLQDKLIGSESFRRKFKKTITEKWEKLHLVVESKHAELRWVTGSRKWLREPDPPDPRDYWVRTKGDESYVWMPMDYLP